jgi:hypothetical protein
LKKKRIEFWLRCTAGTCLLWLATSHAMAQAPLCLPNTLNHEGSPCEHLNDIFSNLGLTNSNGPNASLIFTAFTGATEPAGTTVSFTSGWNATSGITGTANTHATLGYDVSLDPTILAPNNRLWAITSLTLSDAGVIALFAGTQVKITENFCLNASTFTCNSSSPDFGFIQFERDGGNGGTTIDTICFNDGNTSCTPTTGSLTLDLQSPRYQNGVQQVAIQDVLSLTAPPPLHSANLNVVGNNFGESSVPEPVTFPLAGLVLAGFAAALHRRRRAA